MVHTLNSLFKKMDSTKEEMEYQVSMGYLEVLLYDYCMYIYYILYIYTQAYHACCYLLVQVLVV